MVADWKAHKAHNAWRVASVCYRQAAKAFEESPTESNHQALEQAARQYRAAWERKQAIGQK